MAATKKLGTYLDSDDIPVHYKISPRVKKIAQAKTRRK